VLLQTLRTRDFDELAEGFRRWDLRFRQLGGGPFRGELKFLQLGAVQLLGSPAAGGFMSRARPRPAASGSPPSCRATRAPSGAAGAARPAPDQAGGRRDGPPTGSGSSAAPTSTCGPAGGSPWPVRQAGQVKWIVTTGTSAEKRHPSSCARASVGSRRLVRLRRRGGRVRLRPGSWGPASRCQHC